MQIVFMPLAELTAYENNSRLHSDEQIEQIVASITEFGFTNPILINENNRVIAGHGRLAAAEQMGLENVPCIVLDGLTEEQERAYVIADNQIAAKGGWDYDLLKIEVAELQEFGFDISLLAFDEDDLAEIWSEEGEILDYSVLDNSGVDQTLETMQKGVRKAIQIEFKPDDFEIAKELCSLARKNGVYIGERLIEALKVES